MSVPSMGPPLRRPVSTAEPITVSLITDDGQYADRVEARVGDDLAVRRAASIEAALPDVDAVDCLVVDRATTADGATALDRIAHRAPELPIVLLADESTAETAAVETVQSVRWGESLERTASATGVDRLVHRIEAVVERRRLTALSRRTLTGVELADDAIAIVAPDGELEFVNRPFAMAFGYDREALQGRPWRTLFTDDSVERLETTAVPTVADGWRWTGTCTGRRNSGATVPVRVRLGGPGDGGLIFVVETVDADAEAESASDD